MEKQKEPAFLYEKKCKVTEPTGLCLRPSCYITMEVARSCGSAGMRKIFIRREGDGAVADPFISMEVMMLEAREGTELVVCTNDPSLVDKVDSLAKFIDTVNVHTRVDFSLSDLRRVFFEGWE